MFTYTKQNFWKKYKHSYLVVNPIAKCLEDFLFLGEIYTIFDYCRFLSRGFLSSFETSGPDQC